MADDVLDYMRGEGATPFQETARSSPHAICCQAFKVVLLPCCYGSGAEPCASLSRGGREDHFGLALNRGRELSLSRWLLERPLEASLPSLPPGGSGGGGGGDGGGRPDAAAAAAVPAAPALSTSATMSSSSLVACNTNCSGSGKTKRRRCLRWKASRTRSFRSARERTSSSNWPTVISAVMGTRMACSG